MMVNWEKVFLDNGRVRPAWRFFVSLVMIAFVYVGTGILLGLIWGVAVPAAWRASFFLDMLGIHLLLLPGLLGAFKVMTAVFDQKPLAVVGLAFRGRWRVELLQGLGLGMLMVFLVGGSESLLGLATFTFASMDPRRLGIAALFAFVLFALAATNEELIFRGYPFQRLVDSVGPVGAVGLVSIAFGLAHLANPHHTWLSMSNTMLVGIPLSIAYLRTRALWLPIGIHFAWNLLMGFGLGLPVSGVDIPISLLRAQVHGAAWLTGAHYGPEGGLLATGVLIAAMVYLWVSDSIYVSEEMRLLVFGPGLPSEVLPMGVNPVPTSNDYSKDRNNELS